VDEVAKELAEVRATIGSGLDVKRFFRDALLANRAVVTGDEAVEVDLAEAPQALRDAMGLFDTTGFRGRFQLPVAEGEAYLSRTHPYVEGLATHTADAALDGLEEAPAKRLGVIRTSAVSQRTTLLLLRLRFHITDSVGRAGALLAEESQLVAFRGAPSAAEWLGGDEVEALLADLATVHPVRKRPKGEVETFTGKMGQQVETEAVNITTEDYACILFRFRGGARGSLNVSQVTAGRKNCLRYEIAGSKCAFYWDSEKPNELWIGHRERANEVLTRDPSLVGDLARQYINYPGGHNEGCPDAFKQCFRSFYQYIAGGDFQAEPMYPTFAEGHREVALCEAMLQSHQQQMWVEVK